MVIVSFYTIVFFGTLVWGLINLRRPGLPSVDGSTWAISFGVWLFLYFWVSWSVVGKTPGKALFGVRVVTKNGGRIGWFRALLRIPGYLISLLFFFAGFWWVLVSRKNRGWHDYIAGTAVVYDWDARPGRLFVTRPRVPASVQPGASGPTTSGDGAKADAQRS